MNGDPLDPRAFLALAIEEVAILVEDEGLDWAAARLVMEIFSAKPDAARIDASWDEVVAAMSRLDEECVGGPLFALIFNEMKDLSLVGSPFDLCLALALHQALPLLPKGCLVIREAVALLVNEAERFVPAPAGSFGGVAHRLDIEGAHLHVAEALGRMVALGRGGALAVLLLIWMRERPF